MQTPVQTSMQPTPGWYTDPAAPAQLRFWNGSTWTAHAKPRPGLSETVAAAARRSQFKRFRRIG